MYQSFEALCILVKHSYTFISANFTTTFVMNFKIPYKQHYNYAKDYAFLEMLICLTLLLGYSWMRFKHLIYKSMFHPLVTFMNIGLICLLLD